VVELSTAVVCVSSSALEVGISVNGVIWRII
jgi:hypothetical protein